jgi:glycerol kinase
VGGSVGSSGGVVFVPALAGLGAPWWRGEARGSLTGVGLDTTAGHLVRALLDGVAAQVVAAVRAGEQDMGAPVPVLRVDGGLTRSALLLQAQADLLQAPVEVYASPHATALGVAALARLGIEGGDVRSALGEARAAAVVEPRASADEAAARMAAFDGAVRALAGDRP